MKTRPSFANEAKMIATSPDYEKLDVVNKIILHLFNSLQLKSGYLIEQLCLQASTEQLRSLSEDICPGLSHQLYRQVIPLCSIDESLQSVETGKFSIKFPFESTSTFCYCYSLKFAFLFHPTRKDLHELILSKMDFDSVETHPYDLEISCLVGKCIGTKNEHFR